MNRRGKDGAETLGGASCGEGGRKKRAEEGRLDISHGQNSVKKNQWDSVTPLGVFHCPSELMG